MKSQEAGKTWWLDKLALDMGWLGSEVVLVLGRTRTVAAHQLTQQHTGQNFLSGKNQASSVKKTDRLELNKRWQRFAWKHFKMRTRSGSPEHSPRLQHQPHQLCDSPNLNVRPDSNSAPDSVYRLELDGKAV